MSDKVKHYTILAMFVLVVYGLFLVGLVTPPAEISDSERRPLATAPDISAKAILSGKFMKDFESYTMDQFPARDAFRGMKAAVSLYVFGERDVNGIYLADGVISKLEYPLNEESVSNAAKKFRYLYEKYFAEEDARAYVSVIPDKNYFLAEKHGYPSLDYAKLVSQVKVQTAPMQYIDIFDCLELSDYYATDTHWRQERLQKTAERLAGEMGVSIADDYRQVQLDRPFYGVYYGQLALPVDAEPLYYLENDMLRQCTVTDHETGKEIGIYDMEAAAGADAYELFLSGSKSLLTVKNPVVTNGRRLILFRDSFGSSIAPLLATDYEEVVLVDIRYISGELLGDMVDFQNADVLFLYSGLVLNNSVTLK